MYEFDYYIYIDYSENLIGYSIIEKTKIKELLPKIRKFRHYRDARNAALYLKNVNETFQRENIESYFYKIKIKKIQQDLIEIYSDMDNCMRYIMFKCSYTDREPQKIYPISYVVLYILEFLKKHDNCLVFISVDDNQYAKFMRLVNIISVTKTRVIKESELKEDTPEYQLSLVLDNLLNIWRRNKKINRVRRSV